MSITVAIDSSPSQVPTCCCSRLESIRGCSLHDVQKQNVRANEVTLPKLHVVQRNEPLSPLIKSKPPSWVLLHPGRGSHTQSASTVHDPCTCITPWLSQFSPHRIFVPDDFHHSSFVSYLSICEGLDRCLFKSTPRVFKPPQLQPINVRRSAAVRSLSKSRWGRFPLYWAYFTLVTASAHVLPPLRGRLAIRLLQHHQREATDLTRR